MTRILIVKPSSLGDIVHTLPLAHALKRGLPDAHIGWVVDSAFQPLFLCRTRRVRVEISSPHTITHSSLDKAVAARGF